MNPYFFTAPFYFAFIWFRVQGSVGGFAAIIYGAMPDQESFSPLPLEGADERSEAGLVSPRVKIPLREPTSVPSEHLLPKEGGKKVECVDWYLGLKALVAASPRSRAQVAAVLAFVISSATFLAAQDDETGRCPKVACKSLVT